MTHRFGDERVFCNVSADSCLGDSWVQSDLSDATLSVVFFVTNYLSQGYYGLALAFQTGWQSTLGFGFSPMTLNLSKVFTEYYFIERSYQFRIGEAFGWHMEYSWSSFYSWAANDLGWPGSLVIAAIFVFFLGRAFNSALRGNPIACVVLYNLLIGVLFFPMNNQVFQAPGSTMSLIVWSFFWWRTTSRRKSTDGGRPSPVPA